MGIEGRANWERQLSTLAPTRQFTSAALNACVAAYPSHSWGRHQTAEFDPKRKFDLTSLGAKTGHFPPLIRSRRRHGQGFAAW